MDKKELENSIRGTGAKAQVFKTAPKPASIFITPEIRVFWADRNICRPKKAQELGMSQRRKWRFLSVMLRLVFNGTLASGR